MARGSRARLQRTALLLTGDPHSAQDLVQNTLTKLYLAWDRIEQHDRVDAYARRVLVNDHRSTWRRAWRRYEVTTDVLPATGSSSPTPALSVRGDGHRPRHFLGPDHPAGGGLPFRGTVRRR